MEQNIEDLGWTPIDPSYDWSKYGLTVIGERYLEDGRRQHLVEEAVLPGLVLDNADIFGKTDAHLKVHTAACPILQKKMTLPTDSYVEMDLTVISRKRDGCVKIRFREQITTKPHTTEWTRINSKNGGECLVSGVKFDKGAEVYRPEGGVPYRSKRVLANLIDQLTLDWRGLNSK